jgi:FdhE protein
VKSSPIEIAFERRAARAEALARESTTAHAPLDFAAGLYRAQGAVAGALVEQSLGGRLEDDLDSFVATLNGILRFAAENGPPPLSSAALARLQEDQRERLCAWWNQRGNGFGRDDYLSRALLRPYAEVLAGRGLAPQPPADSGGCPFCGGPPWIASRRPMTDGDGAQRLLGCALCGGEWPSNRIRCPACGEESPDKLPIFQSDRHPAVRIETCATCRVYVKSIDLTVDARAIPEVDDLLSLSMDLWAVDEGYTRVEPGLAGV